MVIGTVCPDLGEAKTDGSGKYKMMIASRSIAGVKSLAIIGILLGGCHVKPADNNLKVNVHYWTHTGEERCVNLADISYCFLNKDIEAASFITDAAAGFLFMAATDDPDLIKCAEDWYKIDWEHRPYPNIHMNIGEVRSPKGDNYIKKYYRTRDLELNIPSKNTVGLDLNHILEPRQYVYYFGEKCLKLSDKDLLRREALCHGGDFVKGEPAYFWGCDANGSAPNLSCKSHFFYKNLEYSITTSKKCAPFVNNKLRDFAINFVKQGEMRAKTLSTKARQSIK